MFRSMPLAVMALIALFAITPSAGHAAAPKPKFGTWKGTTSEGDSLRFRVAATTGSEKRYARASLRSLRFRVRMYCTSDKTWINYDGVFPLSAIIDDRSAKVTISKSYQQKDASGRKRNYYLNFQGGFTSSGKVKGTMYVTSTNDGRFCGTRNTKPEAGAGAPLTWKASRTGG